MSSGVEVEDGRAVVVFPPPPPVAMPAMVGIDVAGGQGRLPAPAVEGELAAAVDGGQRGPGCEVTGLFALLPCDSSCICESGAVGGPGDGVGEILLRNGDGGSEPDTGGLAMADGCVAGGEAGSNPAVDVEKRGADVGGVEGGVRHSAMHEVGGNAVDSATTALHPSPLSNSGQNGSFSDRLVGEEQAEEETFSIEDAWFSKLNIGEQQNNVPNKLTSMVDVEESAAREDDARALEAEVVLAPSDVAISMFEGPSQLCASSSLPGCSFQCEENRTSINHVAGEESGSKIMAVHDDKVSCDTDDDPSRNVEELVADHVRVAEPALFDDVGKPRSLIQSSSLFVDIASTISGFHKAMDTEECSVHIINAASCNASEGSASLEISSMFGGLNLTTHASEPSMGHGNSCSSPILENDGNNSLCSSLGTSLVDCCSRKNEPEGKSNGTSLENSSSVAEIGSSVAEVYSPNCPSLACRETAVDHSLPRLTRMRNAARQCRKIMEAISISVSKLRKKRSYLCRRGRSSVWGALVKVIELFEENKKSLKYVNAQSKSRLGGAKARSSKQRRKKKYQIRGSGCTSNVKEQKAAVFGCSETSHVDYSPLAQISDNYYPDKYASKGNTGNQLEIAVAPQVGLDNFTTENNVLAVEIPCDKDIESTVTQDVLVENRSDDFLGISSQIVFESLEEATSGKNTLCGTSPDSAVLYMENGALEPTGELFTFKTSISRDTDSKILSVSGSKDVNPDLIAEGNSIHSISLCGDEKYQEGYQLKSPIETVLEDGVLSTSMEGAVSVAVIPSEVLPSSIEVPCMVSTTTDVSHQIPNPDVFFNTGTTKKEKKYSRRRPVKKVNEGGFSGKVSSISEPMFAAEMGLQNGAKVETVNDISKNAFESLESKEDFLFRKSRKAGKKQSRKKSDSVESTNGRFHGQHKGSSIKISISRRKNRGSLLGKQAAKIQTSFVSSEADVLNRSVAEDEKNMVLECGLNNGTQVVNHLADLKPLSPQMAWVLCDDCEKWRCIPVDLANKINDTNCKWTCKDNEDKNFADCSIPQEKSNAEINAELQLSDGSGDEDFSRMGSISAGVQAKNLDAKQQASWTLIEHNLFLHRNRRTQTIDEIMVCHCKPPSDGGFGCREECLNRMLNIECVQGTCPCGNLCSNQQFQQRKYTKFKWFQCGKKGYGLQLLENVSKGQFLIEYVGEVLDMQAYEARQREYASRGQKHFYFMTLNGSEVIDACAKGNLGRFINHSCEPNCWTEKWMVNGEVCIGLFALRDIKKGEEVTFDYNYVRVFGAAAKKCMCGTSGCRGYLGGDPSNSGAIVQADSDNEYPEPVMVREDGTTVINMSEVISDSEVMSISRDQLESTKSSVQVFLSHVEDCTSKPVFNAQDSRVLDAEYLHDTSVNAFWQSEAPVEKGYDNNSVVASDLLADITHVTDGLQVRRSDPKKSEPKTKASISSVSVKDRERNSNISCEINHYHLLGESTLHSQMSDRNYSTVKNGSKNNKDLVKHKSRRVKQSSQCKSSYPASAIKKGSSCTNQVVAAKSKKLPVGTCGRFEGVEEKLDELLDAEGGISRSKDATKGYLKLLFVTAASGDNAIGETFQSTRDLSIILDALLKTKSRTVLHDIINKNGLQMLHNIMKQNRRHFNRTPIIRKLLKVIEFLAAKGILTSDHINTAPPRDGVESFQDSIFELMRHGDVQVHQIARRFRDQWIPTTVVKTYSNGNGARDSLSRSCHKRWHDQGAKPSEATYCIAEPETGYVPPGASISSEAYSVANANENVGNRPARVRKRKSRWDQPKETNSLGETDYDICKKMTTDQMIATISESTLQHDSTTSGVNNEDAPPGFSCPSSHLVPTNPFPNCRGNAVVASPQSQYLGYLPVSYGIPLALVQELGTSETGGTDRWLIAPGVPFHPFPPLPSHPREPRSLCESPEVMDSQHRESAGSSQEATATRQSPKLDVNLGRRYFRQKKWNKGYGRSPPWLLPQKNGQALKDDEHSGGSTPNSATCTDNIENEVPA